MSLPARLSEASELPTAVPKLGCSVATVGVGARTSLAKAVRGFRKPPEASPKPPENAEGSPEQGTRFIGSGASGQRAPISTRGAAPTERPRLKRQVTPHLSGKRAAFRGKALDRPSPSPLAGRGWPPHPRNDNGRARSGNRPVRALTRNLIERLENQDRATAHAFKASLGPDLASGPERRLDVAT